MTGQLIRTRFITKQAEVRQCRYTSSQDTQQSIQVFHVTIHCQVINCFKCPLYHNVKSHVYSFIALTLLVGCREGNPACKNILAPEIPKDSLKDLWGN